MARIVRELTALEVRQLTKPGAHTVGGVPGLMLQVTPGGGRSWILRTMVGRKRRHIGLGSFPAVSLAAARKSAQRKRELIRKGIDPIEQRRAKRQALIDAQEQLLTFDQATERFLATKLHEFRSDKHAAQWGASLSTYASPIIGNMAVDTIELRHILNILEPIWTTKTETATRVRGRIESVLAWATVGGYRSGDNPARWKGHLDAVLPKPSRVARVRHHRALPINEMPQFMRDLQKRDGLAAKALEFLILTAARSGEVRGATWDELNFDSCLWVIPAERMKAGREHRVPLTESVIALLKALPRRSDSPYLFPAVRGGKLSDMAMVTLMRRMKVDAVPHGFRSTFRDWCAEHTNYPSAMAEMALAHTIDNKVEAAYRRGDMVERRRQMMRDWSNFCFSIEVAAA